MVKVDLSRINTTHKTLANGTRKTYYYHRATGTRLPGEKGSPAFLEAYIEAERLDPIEVNNISELIRDYLLSSRFLKNKKGRTKAESTKKEYRRILTILDAEFGDMPIKALDVKAVRGVFIDYQERIAIDREREADNRLTVLSLVFSYATDKGRVNRNPLERFERIYSADRSEMIWTEADVTRFMDGAPVELQRAMILAIHTGQRYGDLIRLRWSDYNGNSISLKQSKTSSRVNIKCTEALKRMLDATSRTCPFILARADGAPWQTARDDKALAKAWHCRTEAAGFYPLGWQNMTKIEKRDFLRFNDMRGTAVTLLSEAGASIPQICSITGHTLQSATRILERYLAKTAALSSAAIHLFENATETAFANRMQTTPDKAVATKAKNKGNQ